MSRSLHRTALPVAVALFVAGMHPGAVPAQEKPAAATEKTTGDNRVNDAIDKGIAYLLREIEKEQAAPWDDPKRTVGQVALETYALIVAGVDVEHPLIKRNFDYLASRALGTGYTYTLACYAFALDAARKSVVRASYARYAGQMNPSQVTLASPVGSYYSYIAYRWNDLNGDHLAQKNEVLTNLDQSLLTILTSLDEQSRAPRRPATPPTPPPTR